MLTLSSPPLYKLIESLNEDLSNKIPELNAGGCGVFASLMYKKLKSLGYEPKIVILDCTTYELEHKKNILNRVMNRERTRFDDTESTSFAHCYIKVDGVIFDGLRMGSNVLCPFWAYDSVGEYTIEELDTCLKVGSWNPSFKRRKRNPTLRASINKAVKEVYNT